jgi:hypothetical protein
MRVFAEIDGPDALIRGDRLRRAFGQKLPRNQHRNTASEIEHKVHVVLDQEDRDVRWQSGEGGENILPLLLRHAGGGFVQLDLPRTLDRLWGNFPSYWTCPERWTAYGGISRPMTAIGRLEAPMDFMNSVGVLLPMELWGRCVLYSCLNASHFTWASANDKNQF